MKNSVKYFILIIILLCIGGTGIWYFLLRLPDMASFEELQQEFDRDLLTATEHELLGTFADHFRRNKKDKAAAIVIDNKFQFRGIFYKLLQNGLILKLKNEPDSSDAKMEIALEIANVYEKNLGDGFLRREFDFCNSLNEKHLVQKLTLDLLYNKGQKSLWQGDHPVARKYYEKSLKLSRKIGDSRREVDNLLKIQYILYTRGSYKKALQFGKEILDIVRHTGYLYREAWALYNIGGLILFDLGEYRKALEELETALNIAKTLDDYTGEMKILGRMVIAARRLGEFSKALSVSNKALELCQKFGDQSEEVRIYNDRGLVYKNMGDFAKAQEDFKRALKISEELKDYNRAIVRVNLGELSRLLGDYDKALKYHLEALELNYKSENYYDIALTKKCVGDVYQDQGNYHKALEFYQQALRTIEQSTEAIRPRRLESEIWLSIGDINRERREWQLAQESYRKALNTFKKIEFQEGIVLALVRIGNVLREKGDFKKALEHFSEGIDVADKLKDPMLLSNAYYGIGLVHRDQGKFDSAEQDFTDAIRIVETTREKIIGYEKINYFATIQDLYDEMILLQYKQSKNVYAFNFSERARARAFLDLFQSNAKSFIENKLTRSLPPTLREVQAALDGNIMLIEYKVTDDKLIIFVIDQKSLKVSESDISRQELRNLVFEFRKVIGAEAESVFKEKIKTNSKDVYEHFLKLSKKLYSVTIEPIKDDILSDKTIYFVPDDVLYYLPFGALVSTRGSQGKFLIQEYTIAYAPSAAILKYCLDHRKPTIPPSQMKLLAVGNPTLNLAGSEREARKIAGMFPDSDTLIGEIVTEETVVKSLSKGFNIIHFATHAVIDEKSPLYSYLVLGKKANLSRDTTFTRSSIRAYDGDDLLMTHEVFNLNLSEARLVTLSACNTASGRLFRGEGIVGLTRAFMKAGSYSIVTTQWNIDDKFTERIMTTFYEQWKNKKMSKAQALRAAQLKIITEMKKDRVIKFPHPYAWAAFTLTGDYH